MIFAIVLRRMFAKRLKTLPALGYTLERARRR